MIKYPSMNTKNVISLIQEVKQYIKFDWRLLECKLAVEYGVPKKHCQFVSFTTQNPIMYSSVSENDNYE